jgi:CRP/FNR family cyclic AMP-dependent transcriptional regulator
LKGERDSEYLTFIQEELAMTFPVKEKDSTHGAKFFDGLPEDALAIIMGYGDPQLVSAKNTIITGGKSATHLYLLKAGRAKYYRVTESGGELMFRLLTPGDVFGLGTLLEHPLAYIGSAEAISDCEIVIWQHKTVRMLAGRYPRLGENALRIVIEYLTNYADRHTGLVSKSADHRLATVLISLARRTGEMRPDGVKLKATNEQLGGLADTSHFNVSRILSRWHREGAIHKERGAVVVHSPELLPFE